MIAEVVKEMLEDDEPEVGLDTEASTVCFADDTTVLLSTSSDENMEKAMTMCSEQFGRYFSTQGMKVNKSKEEHIVFYPKKMERNLENGVVIKGRKEAETVKLLGLSVSTGYSFKTHCSKIISKTNQRLGHVRRLQKYLTPEKLQQVTDSLVLSILRYGLEWSGRERSNLVRLQKTLNVVLRMLTKSSMYTSIRYMLSKTGLMNIKLQCSQQRMSLVRRCLMTETTPITLTMVKFPKEKSRSGDYRSLIGNQTRYGEKSIITVGLDLLNGLGYGKLVQTSGRHPSKDSFNSKSSKYLKEKMDNGNVK